MNEIRIDNPVADNVIQTFTLESSSLRGRMVKLGSVLEDIMTAHAYPENVSELTAQAAMLAVLLSSMLKYEGIFTLQTQGDGPVSMVVADMTSEGHLRACATVRDQYKGKTGGLTPEQLSGSGYLAFTVDQGGDTERYQGIVELKHTGLADSVQHYFRQSEQIATGLRMAVQKVGGHWRGGGLLLQSVPEEGGIQAPLSSTDEDDWRRTMLLLETCTDAELLDPALSAQALLFRLFHEEGVRVYDPAPITKKCRCSHDKLESLLKTMPADDIAHMVVDGQIRVTCEFCSSEYIFDPAQFADKNTA